MSLASRVFLGAYGALWQAARPALRRHTRLREGFEERLVPEGWPFEGAGATGVAGISPGGSGGLCIWFQAASGGEAWLVHSLLRSLLPELAALPKTFHSSFTLLCTTCTRQGLDVLEKLPAALAPDLALLGLARRVSIVPRYFPLDSPTLMERALCRAAPLLLVLLETELWPGLLGAARQHKTPVLLLNARMTKKSLSGYRLASFFWKEHPLAGILAISEDDAARFAELFGPRGVSTMPNIKFDRAADREGSNAGARTTGRAAILRAAAGIEETTLLAVLASVREEEEDLLLPVVDLLRESVPGHTVAVVVAPRHLHRVQAWEKKLAAAGMPSVLWSARGAIQSRAEPGEKQNSRAPLPGGGSGTSGAAFTQPGGNPAVCLWDTFGELRDLYAMADAVFVGGSLAPLGGQNFLESLSEGIIPVVGPHVGNFAWVGEDIFARMLAYQVQDAGALLQTLGAGLLARCAALTGDGPDSPAGTNSSILRGGQRRGGPGLDLRGLDRGEPGKPEAWNEARALEADWTRERFARWLEPRLGGSARGARAVAEALRKLLG